MKRKSKNGNPLLLDSLFPEQGRLFLTGGGKEFIERIGVDAAKKVVLGILQGENVRAQTEPLTRRRLTQVSAAMTVLFARGWSEVDDFSSVLSQLAIEQFQSVPPGDHAKSWPAQWILGITGKSFQNVLRGDHKTLESYVSQFESAINDSTLRIIEQYGPISSSLGFLKDPRGTTVELGWKDLTRWMTAIGSLTLTIRGSDKSVYGKLYERLVLGSILTILGFRQVNPRSNQTSKMVFWLADSRDNRESDATAIVREGKVAHFDIGFIGPGNPEISKDKLSRYARDVELAGRRHSAQTYIIIDKISNTGKTRQAAARIGAEILQMSMQHWTRDLAQRLKKGLDLRSPLTNLSDSEIAEFLEEKLEPIRIQDFLTGIKPADLVESQDEVEDQAE